MLLPFFRHFASLGDLLLQPSVLWVVQLVRQFPQVRLRARGVALSKHVSLLPGGWRCRWRGGNRNKAVGVMLVVVRWEDVTCDTKG